MRHKSSKVTGRSMSRQVHKELSQAAAHKKRAVKSEFSWVTAKALRRLAGEYEKAQATLREQAALERDKAAKAFAIEYVAQDLQPRLVTAAKDAGKYNLMDYNACKHTEAEQNAVLHVLEWSLKCSASIYDRQSRNAYYSISWSK